MIELRDASERLVLDFAGYGSRRVTQALRRSGWLVNHQRVLRVMRDEALLCQLQRRLVGTTAATHAYRTSPNLLAGAALDSTGSTRPARPSVGGGHPRYPAAHDLRLFGLRPGGVRAALQRVAALPPDRHEPDLGGLGEGQ